MKRRETVGPIGAQGVAAIYDVGNLCRSGSRRQYASLRCFYRQRWVLRTIIYSIASETIRLSTDLL